MKSLDSEEVYSGGSYRRAFEIVGRFVEDFLDGIEVGRAVNTDDIESVERIIFVGIGGSGIIGDVAAQLLSASGVEADVLKSYNLPKDKWDLAVAISYSGNTAETIKPVLDLIDHNTPCIFITSDGFLSEFATRKGIPTARVKKGVPPRYGFPNMLGAVLGVIDKIGLMHVEFEPEELKKFQRKIMEKNDTESNPAKQAALKIAKSNPIVYIYEEVRNIGYRLKCQLNENAKIYCGFGEIPEALHNEIEAIGPNDLIILPRISVESDEMKETIETLTRFLEGERCLSLKADSKEGLEELLELFMLMDYISLYVSILKDADPMTLPRVTELRKINRINEEILRQARSRI